MIYDCFTFFNEFEILDIRLEELSPVVDCFVIVESNLTFSGREKPYLLSDNLESYSAYSDKIRIVKSVSDPSLNSWGREYAQRTDIGYGLYDAWPNDIVIVSDADEIPRRSTIYTLDTSLEKQAIGLDVFYYGLNTMSVGDEHTIRAVQYKHFNEIGGAQLVRTENPDSMHKQEHAGWHFSYLGDVEHIINKFRSFSHTELDRADTNDPDTLMERMRAGRDLWGDGHQYTIVNIDDTWPEAIKNNREYWRKYEWKPE